MCSVSMIYDYYRDRSRDWQPMPGPAYPYNPPPLPVQPGSPLPPPNQWDVESQRLLREVLDRLDKLDKRLGDIECSEPDKAELRRKLGLDPQNHADVTGGNLNWGGTGA